ncbi:DUF637 domain-containing protein [Hydrogenophaga sp. MI9]|uniref:DUF637 domain-containing protein n=1 Tax=Hydrogenophaga sp. MI9 TaxID=3453719 RepID=UPI003EEECA38
MHAQSPHDANGNPTGKGPVWSFENSTYNQSGVNISVGGNLDASAGGDMQLTTALQGHVQSFDFYNRYNNSGNLIHITQTATVRDTDLINSGNSWSSGGSMNLSAGGNIALTGVQISSQGFSASAGGNYSEQAAYDVHEQVNNQSIRYKGPGTYIADSLNNTTWLTTSGATISGAVGSAVTAGLTSLASTAAVSLINNQGDIGATLQELGSGQNMRGLLLTMATAGLSQGILSNIPLEGGGTLASVNASSNPSLLLARNAVQGITSAVLESAVMGTSLEDALQHNLQSALINTAVAQGANAIGDAHLNETSRALAHALLGCAVGAANAGGSAGCAPGAAGAAIGEIVASLYANASGYDQLRLDANQPGASAELQQQLAVVTNTMTELARLSGAGAALLIGGDASAAQIAMGTAANVAVNNRQLHTNEQALAQTLANRSGGRYTAAQIADALRNSGNNALGETVATGMVVNTGKPNGVYDSGATFNAGAQGTNTIVQTLPNNGQVDAALASFILANTGGANSPYSWSDSQLGKTPAQPSTSSASTSQRYETRVVNGQTFTVPVVDCPATSCQNTDNVAHYGLSAQDQAAVQLYEAAVQHQTIKGVGNIVIGGVAVAATPVTLTGLAAGGPPAVGH